MPALPHQTAEAPWSVPPDAPDLIAPLRAAKAGTRAKAAPSRTSFVPAAVAGGLCFLLLWAPIPLGSNRPWAWSLLAAGVGVLAILGGLAALAAPMRLRTPWVVILAGLSTVAVWGWAWLQTVPLADLPALPWLVPHPTWAELASSGLDGVVPVMGLDAAAARDALMRLMSYGAVFWLAFVTAQEPRLARRLLWAILAATAICAAYGLFDHFAGRRSIGWIEKTAYIHDVTGTFVNRNNFATFANLGLVVCLGLLAEPFLAARSAGEARRIAAEAIERLLGWRAVLLATAGVLATAMLLSHSRGGFLSMALAAALFLFLVFLMTRPRAGVVLVVLAVAFAAGWGVLAVSGEATLKRLEQTDSDANAEGSSRLAMWQLSLGLVAERPWLGHGYGNFEQAFTPARDDRFKLVVDKAHNTYIEHLVELGIPATLALYLGPVLLFGYCLRALFLRQRGQVFPLIAVTATVLVGLHALVDFSLQIPAVAVAYAAILGIGVAQSLPSRRQSRENAAEA